MHRPNLLHLPDQTALPEGYQLRVYQQSDEYGLSSLLTRAFPETEWSVQSLENELTTNPGVLTIFVIAHLDSIIATATSLVETERPATGVVHWVAVDPDHRGKQLGYQVTLAVLHDFLRNNFSDSLLRTDDVRLPAIKTYLKLGFEPLIRSDEDQLLWNKTLVEIEQG